METNNPMKEHIVSWKQSGKSISGYCKMKGIPYHRFLYWMKKEAIAGKRQSKENRQVKGFVPIDMEEDMDNRETVLEVEIETNGKVILKVCKR
jgi:hypothetical protein